MQTVLGPRQKIYNFSRGLLRFWQKAVQELKLQIVEGYLVHLLSDCLLELGGGAVHEHFVVLGGYGKLSCRVRCFLHHEYLNLFFKSNLFVSINEVLIGFTLEIKNSQKQLKAQQLWSLDCTADIFMIKPIVHSRANLWDIPGGIDVCRCSISSIYRYF